MFLFISSLFLLCIVNSCKDTGWFERVEENVALRDTMFLVVVAVGLLFCCSVVGSVVCAWAQSGFLDLHFFALDIVHYQQLQGHRLVRKSGGSFCFARHDVPGGSCRRAVILLLWAQFGCVRGRLRLCCCSVVGSIVGA